MGLNTYWSQFEGLYERLCKYQKKIAEDAVEKRVAYEVSVSKLEYVDEPMSEC